MKRNPNMGRITKNYLFSEVEMQKRELGENNPGVDPIALSVGDVRDPLPKTISSACAEAGIALGMEGGYGGYGPERGEYLLRRAIAEKEYEGRIDPEEIFVSDGAKCDLGRLQTLFGSTVSIAVQDPSYPVYVDGSRLQGVTDVRFMPCLPENGFVPDFGKVFPVDVIYFCSPNNPTGEATSRERLEELVLLARKNRSVIVFDAAYARYVSTPGIPRSIFEIEGADETAVEVNSFSKSAGFTGIRLGWTVVPKRLTYDDGSSIREDWSRLVSTLFNGASRLAQAGGRAALTDEGMREAAALREGYSENGRLLRQALEEKGYEVFGGLHVPYLWVRVPECTRRSTSLHLFRHLLEECRIVTTPGSGFGSAGEGYVRISAFGKREDVREAVRRLRSPRSR
ncbi:MAG: LL-diaminopimelate aminotransferase [Simkaniaceae bacterium]|nr:LL-diaminopimelate aminotransferase [Simkaniaceae bacterium]